MHLAAGSRKVMVSADGGGAVSQAGGLLLPRTLEVTGLDRGLEEALEGWRAPRAVHSPGKIASDLAVALALGGDCLADVAMLRAEPGLFGAVASDPVVSRLVARLAAEAPRALKAIRAARAAARTRAWELAGHHPLTVFADHGPLGSGEALAVLLRAGNAGSNTAADHIAATRLALAQLPRHLRRRALIRTDSGGGTHEFLNWLTKPGRRLAYSVGFTITEDVQEAILKVPAGAWTPAYDAEGRVRPGAWVAEITGMLDLASWPPGMRGDRPQGTPPPRRAVALHRHRWAPVHLLCHQHERWPARGPGTASQAPGQMRGPGFSSLSKAVACVTALKHGLHSLLA